MIVGVLGGIGAGKSTVSRMLADLGAEAVDADALAREVLDLPETRGRLEALFGREAVGRGEKVDRKALSRRVFTNPQDLKKLEGLLHPEVLRRIEMKVAEHKKRKKKGEILVLDVPLLLESSLAGRCDALVFVEASAASRSRRVRERGWDSRERRRRESAQRSLAEKRRVADHVIDNSGSIARTRRQVEALHAAWKRAARPETED
jgi:dephospho-CoA kinase